MSAGGRMKRGRQNHMERICCIFGAGRYRGRRMRAAPVRRLCHRGGRGLQPPAGLRRPARPCRPGISDSMGAPPDDVPSFGIRRRKDDTDMLLAVREGFARLLPLLPFGGTGGRIDHTLANSANARLYRRTGRRPACSGRLDRRSRKNGTLGFPAGLSWHGLGVCAGQSGARRVPHRAVLSAARR